MNSRSRREQLIPGLEALMLVFLVATVASCSGDDPVGPSSPPVIKGRVLDANGVPVQGAHIGIMFEFSAPNPHAPTILRRLSYNHPNPFSTVTRLQFAQAVEGHARLEVLDRDNRSVAILFDGIANEGVNEVFFQPTTQPNGYYIARLETVENNATSVSETPIFRQDENPGSLNTAYHAKTNANGQFELALDELPLGETVIVTSSDSPEPLAENSVLSTIHICAFIDNGGSQSIACVDVDLGDRSRSVLVEISL